MLVYQQTKFFIPAFNRFGYRVVMKLKLLFLFLLFSASGFGQSLFHSPYTQHWPTMFTTEYEEVDRSISIGKEEITIVSELKKGKEVQTYLIRDIQVNRDHIAYECASRDGKSVARLLMPLQKEIRHLDLYRASARSGEEVQLRFLIDYYYE